MVFDAAGLWWPPFQKLFNQLETLKLEPTAVPAEALKATLAGAPCATPFLYRDGNTLLALREGWRKHSMKRQATGPDVCQGGSASASTCPAYRSTLLPIARPSPAPQSMRHGW